MNQFAFLRAAAVAVLSLGLAQPLAAQEALSVIANGNVGVGVDAPAASLHVQRDDGNARLLVEETSATPALRELFTLVNNGDPSFVLRDSSSGRATEFRLLGPSDAFSVNHIGTGGADFRLSRNGELQVGKGGQAQLLLEPSGDLTIAGTLSQNSDVHAKHEITPVQQAEVLDKVLSLPITTWVYRADDAGSRHLGPMAQDFHAAFGLGGNPTKLAPGDMAGVALAAIQAQQQQIDTLQARNAELEAELQALREAVTTLGAGLQKLQHASWTASAQ